MPSNQAAWYTELKAKPLVVKDAPYPTPNANEIVIKNGAIAINPVDWKIQDYGLFIETFPMILGTDVAGEVVEVGDKVKNFAKGDRVVSHALSLSSREARHGGFQLYSVATPTLTSKIPDSLTFERAVTVALSVSTAAAGLFEKNHLGLAHPDESLSPKSTGSTVLIWGGSSSVGCSAIQLAAAAGYEVFTTASAHNHELCKSLGAAQVFDHTKDNVVEELVKAFKGKKVAGAFDAISSESTISKCVEVLGKLDGSKTISTTLPPPENLPSGIKAAGVFASTIKDNEVGPAVWETYLPKALAAGKFQAKPDPLVIGHGLEHVQEGMEANKKGVSGKKVVITL